MGEHPRLALPGAECPTHQEQAVGSVASHEQGDGPAREAAEPCRDRSLPTPPPPPPPRPAFPSQQQVIAWRVFKATTSAQPKQGLN